MNKLQLKLHSFLKKHLNSEKPLLIALSGGPDSLALLHLLLDYQQKHSMQLGIAHVDHKWRAESSEEALQLAHLAHSLQIPFHLKELNPEQLKGNLEEACRKERLTFFSELCKEYGYQAVVLAHHANDQAETVLKRLLEGAALSSLGGLQDLTEIEGTPLWRPLLQCSKAEIVEWLEQKKLTAFEDKTNYDPKYLRARFRTKIIPYLTQVFGKEIQHNLYRLAEEAHELQNYFQEKLKYFPIEVNDDKSKILISLPENSKIHPYELKMMLKEFLRNYHIIASYQQLQTITNLLLENKSNKQIAIGNWRFIIDRKNLFIFNATIALPFVMQDLSTGICGNWKITVDRSNQPRPNKIGWKNVWRGHLELSLPAANYLLGPVDCKMPYPNKSTSIDKWWANEKVPAFLRTTVPVIWEDKRIRHEFLSSRYMNRENVLKDSNDWLHITLKT